jgi:hypothetical protein
MSRPIPDTFNTSVEEIYNTIKTASSPLDILKPMCYVMDGEFYFDYRYFKPIGTPEIYQELTNYIVNQMRILEPQVDKFTCHVCLKGLGIKELDKHSQYIKLISTTLDTTFPNKLTKCYIYNASSVFSYLFKLLSYFVDKVTLSKVTLVESTK